MYTHSRTESACDDTRGPNYALKVYFRYPFQPALMPYRFVCSFIPSYYATKSRDIVHHCCQLAQGDFISLVYRTRFSLNIIFLEHI
jgi:hypothetical protein